MRLRSFPIDQNPGRRHAIHEYLHIPERRALRASGECAVRAHIASGGPSSVGGNNKQIASKEPKVPEDVDVWFKWWENDEIVDDTEQKKEIAEKQRRAGEG